MLQVHPREMPFPVWLRPGTSDIILFEEIILDRRFSSLPLGNASTIVDLGANIGLFSIYFANQFPRAKILAVEPDPENFELLKKNAEKYTNIQVIQAAVWDSDEPVRIDDPGLDYWARRVVAVDAQSNRSRTVRGQRIQTLLQDAEIGTVDLMKIDIEGAEKKMFAGPCDDWLKVIKALVIELHDRFDPGSSNAFYKAISDRRFSQSTVGESVFIQFH
jgi:FkbM family methyltransferase